jgi:hypothetical protein
MTLITAPNFHTPGDTVRHAYTPGDEFYGQLVAAHRGLTPAQSELLQARLVLLLANHIGDLGVLQQAVAAARAGLPPESPPTAPSTP